ncbi:hypothetical protein BUALT_Bualt09G0051100 [Buddleja alternifolia]|uniref:Cytochrome P450 n=1 Tax=Buddleja alternifolia TaxID=168488 RepID=A0AAV6X7E6_9LAMI|nr:hypothetical protein BUALT_Bualt09G0051100 [Buddleja alternifolia]
MGITGPRNTNLPPGTRGWPILGETMEIPMLGPQKFVKNKIVKYSPEIFQTSLFLERTTVFCGAQGNKFVFTNNNKVLTSWWPQSLGKIFLVPQFLQKNIKDASALQHRFYHDIFKPKALRQYIPVMDALARDHLDHEWTPNEVVKVLPLTKKYTFELRCKLMLGVVDPEHIKRLTD